VLVVDDFLPMRILLGQTLRGWGFDVVLAENGLDALEKLVASGPFDLAFVDWNMPEMNGLELVRAMRAERVLDAMRIMMITTSTETKHIAAALDAGADEYLMKPFTAGGLRDKLALLELPALGSRTPLALDARYKRTA
jgi:two-component system chemotaxis response regulator CheY